MNARNEKMDWHVPPRVTTPEPRRGVASIEAWRTSPFVARELDRSARIGFGWGCAVTIVCALILWFAMGVRP